MYYTATSSGAHYVETGAYNFYYDENDEFVDLGPYMYSLTVEEIESEDVPLPP